MAVREKTQKTEKSGITDEQKKEPSGLTNEQKKAIQVLFNVADLAVRKGVFNNTDDVALVHSGKSILNELIK
ncbi:hypothetical protein BTO06_09760 [Tenacibaculum sp. SZ-18]|uniref:hypothetical protein n=1 Tax=Tenacibaculum sp. SZ-18 TaxID=754423 RepID=UPI000C2D63B1|nr:hypothetical protein [Tenacibaculum sp. SZ-18]AUC15405.1 hypothetical protein BTO06_09760 [Tenacibaculum sp. SZ-18]